ncbi:MAG: hypothetical protein WA117_22045 [Verrucomicrobiia bacterium]
MKKDILNSMLSIALKVKILREWQESNCAKDHEFSERQQLALELIKDFAPITEKSLCKIFGLSFSSINDIVKRLAEMRLIDTSDKTRGKPLILTELGVAKLAKLKEASITRFGYLLDSMTEEEWIPLRKILEKIDKNAERTIQQMVFDRYSSD